MCEKVERVIENGVLHTSIFWPSRLTLRLSVEISFGGEVSMSWRARLRRTKKTKKTSRKIMTPPAMGPMITPTFNFFRAPEPRSV
jgi:hypothetical protein